MPNAIQPDQRRSPLDREPLNLPGRSLRRMIIEAFFDEFFWKVAWLITALVALIEWGHFLLHAPSTLGSCIGLTVVSGVFAGVALYKIRGKSTKLNNLALGMDGEIAVGQFLEEHCRTQGYYILHDIPGDGFNIDHVLIGPGGIFSIETKTHSKPAKGPCIVKYDGSSVLVNGYKPDRDPIVQTKACASYLRKLLAESTSWEGASIPIQPVVLYPGWTIEGKSTKKEVWVLHPQGLLAFLDYEDVHLLPDDVKLFYSRLAEHVRQKSS